MALFFHFSSQLSATMCLCIFFFLFNCFFFFSRLFKWSRWSPLTVLKNVTIATNAFIYVSLTKLWLNLHSFLIRSFDPYMLLLFYSFQLILSASIIICSLRLHLFFSLFRISTIYIRNSVGFSFIICLRFCLFLRFILF